MTMQLNPYLTFPGNTEEAMSYYADVLGGTVRSMTFRESGVDIPGVMHSALETPAGFHIFAADHMPGMGPELVQGTHMQMSVSGDDAQALSGYYARLAADGQVVVQLEKQMWGDVYGQVVDKYGICWHVNVSVENGESVDGEAAGDQG